MPQYTSAGTCRLPKRSCSVLSGGMVGYEEGVLVPLGPLHSGSGANSPGIGRGPVPF
ncbi:MAG: hypothetical protein ACUVTZ_09660 [Armatimonadota bacterium]